MKYVLPFAVLSLSGCAQLGFDANQTETAPRSPLPQTSSAPPPPAAARTVEQFDTTTQAQREAAAAPSTSVGQELGSVVATLGDPSQPGFWVETALVTARGMGRITLLETGQSVEVELRPITDGSARVSLAAWRLLEVPLTDLAEIAVFAG